MILNLFSMQEGVQLALKLVYYVLRSCTTSSSSTQLGNSLSLTFFFLVLFQSSCSLKDLENELQNRIHGGAGDWTRDFPHAKRTLYLWVTPPTMNQLMAVLIVSILLCLFILFFHSSFLTLRFQINSWDTGWKIL